MGYLDLNIPYNESDRHTKSSTLNHHRLKLTLKSLELGYNGVTFNRTLKGVMADSHRCSIPLFPLSKITPISSSFLASVEFHRNLLNVAVSSPFRQFTRLTVVVDGTPQVSALNSGNPVLRSYDVVAVRPMNQNAFDMACQTCEVDLIAIDFAQKLPFRLKQNMVKAAIKRGLYFEVTYSGLIADVQSRREIITNCKLLVDWTRGKNLIFSSAATSATELRGPQDVANLVSLLGLSMERAKAAISKNCRTLLANALRKKNFYKEAVKVEAIPSVGKSDSDKSPFEEWLKWDPISSGEGDLLLDDIKKSFSMSKAMPKPRKPIDFISAMNGLPAHGLQIKDVIIVNKAAPLPPLIADDACADMETEESVKVHEITKEPDGGMPEELENVSENNCSFDALTNGNVPQSLNESKRIDQASDCSTIRNFSVQTGACTISGAGIANSSEKAAKLQLQDTESPMIGYNALSAGQVLVETADGEGMHTEEDIAVDVIADKTEMINERDSLLVSSNETIDNVYEEGGRQKEINNSDNRLDDLAFEELFNIKAKFKDTISGDAISDRRQTKSIISCRELIKLPDGRERRKRNQRHQPVLFPFKRLLNPRPLKRKSRK